MRSAGREIGVRALLLRVHATPGAKIEFEGARPRGYYQRLGVTARDEADLLNVVRQYVSEDTGGTVVEIDDLEVADLGGPHRDIREVCQDSATPGVWYASGRAFYDDEDDENE